MPSDNRPSRARRAAAWGLGLVVLLAGGAGGAGAQPASPPDDPAAARLLDEADAAIRRGRFGRGHDLLRQATETDSGSAVAWYRRSVAAELAHRAEDADRAIAEAERRAALADAAGLSARDRRLIRAQALWRAGDALAADSILRLAVRDDARDADAWFGLAEVAYHAGPLYGRPLDLAREPWRRLVALDSSSYPSIMHLVRLEARAGDTAAVRRLLGRAAAIGATGAAALESGVVAAYATGRDADTARATATLDSLPHFSVAFMQAVVAGMLERPDLAVGIARRLVRPSRPAAVRAGGHLALARLHVATGRWRDAMAELDRAAELDAEAAGLARARLVALPFVDVGASDVERARRGVRGPRGGAGEPAIVSAYLAASLDLRASPDAAVPASLAGCDAGAAADLRAACALLHAGLRVAHAPDDAAALAALERALRALPAQLAARAPHLAGTRERWLLAEGLARLGRDAEAERWYAAVPHGSFTDHVYLAASHLRRGAIRERAGDPAGAAAHYRRVVALLPAPDAELRALRREADAGLRRATAAR